MNKKTLYLCGPINGRTTEDATGWREAVKLLWKGKTIDPMRRDYRGRELEPGIAKEIVEGDIQDINNSDAVLVFFDKPSVGTAMEVFYAHHNLHKEIVVVNASDKPLSPWLIHHTSAQVTSVKEALAILAETEPLTIEGGTCDTCGEPNMAHMGGSCYGSMGTGLGWR